MLDKVAQKFDGAVRERHYEFKTLDMKESVILRDGINASTNGMVKLASMINALRPDLEDMLGIQLFPHYYAANFALWESAGDVPTVGRLRRQAGLLYAPAAAWPSRRPPSAPAAARPSR